MTFPYQTDKKEMGYVRIISIIFSIFAGTASAEICLVFEDQLPSDPTFVVWQGYRAKIDSRASEILKTHPVTKLTEKLRADKISVQFVMPGGQPVDQPKYIMMGEDLQSRLLQGLLEKIFPSASFVSARNLTASPEAQIAKRIGMHISDIHESTNFREAIDVNHLERLPAPFTIDMGLLKQGNPVRPQFDKETVRKKLGINNNDMVASFYVDWGRDPSAAKATAENPAFSQILAAIPEQLKPSIIFFSGAKGGHAEHLDEIPEFQVTKLSELNSESNLQGKWIVINDTQGRVPEIHAASDFAFVNGPMNIFEGLQVGTPTVFFNNHDMMSGYDDNAFDRMSKRAIATGGGFSVKTLSDVKQSVALAIAGTGKAIFHPALTRVGNETRTPFEKLLDRIYDVVYAQTYKDLPPVFDLYEWIPAINHQNGFDYRGAWAQFQDFISHKQLTLTQIDQLQFELYQARINGNESPGAKKDALKLLRKQLRTYGLAEKEANQHVNALYAQGVFTRSATVKK